MEVPCSTGMKGEEKERRIRVVKKRKVIVGGRARRYRERMVCIEWLLMFEREAK